MKNILTARIATGQTRAEERQPSHDGEYITVYYVPGEADVVAENNGGTFSLDDEGGDDPDETTWIDIRAEAYALMLRGDGEPLRSCGSEAKSEIIALAWASDADFDGNSIISA